MEASEQTGANLTNGWSMNVMVGSVHAIEVVVLEDLFNKIALCFCPPSHRT